MQYNFPKTIKTMVTIIIIYKFNESQTLNPFTNKFYEQKKLFLI
jgi:hypothetical protein